ncbi:hypothetical protein JG687_00014838 [Phytophthora cactorum]|uniref:Serine aminopeptidase S33 domain-containing protein n=1 Tax=Phytophthora cactorum TaxID=29920 RepID=A0A8T1TVG0_9STRA|nr:hypothetical protein JG687_00014838 [Phytophthora cactorum]
MEIFQDGELEAEMHKREIQANSLGSWWNLFSETYEELVQSIASPVRAEYSVRELGDRQLSLATVHNTSEEFVREDFHLHNARREHLACSFWRRRAVREADPIAELARSSSSSSLNSEEEKMSAGCSMEEPPAESVSTDSSSNSSWSSQQTAQPMHVDPCIIYLHGMSSSRKECVYLHHRVLAAGFSLFALDLSGSGLSGGDRVSFGYFEHDDVRTVVDYLYATGRASAVGIWGRDIGSAAALLHVKQRMPYHYETIMLSKKDAKKLEVVEDKEHHHILCIPPVTGLHFRFSKYSAAHGDFVLLAIDNVPVQGLSPAACYRLIQRSCKTNGGKACLQGFKKRSSSDTGNDKFIFALTADSVYGDMEQVIWDMLQMITKSAERRSLFFPSAMVTASQKILANSIGKAGGFSLRDVRLLDAAPYFKLPCLFIRVFDRFRFGAKRERDEDTANATQCVEDNANDAAEAVAETLAKRSKNKHKEPEIEQEALGSGKWQERWHAICNDCFEQAQPCVHYPEHRLRLLIVGHNPSDHAWKTGYSYSNPTNRMWMLLTGTLSPHSWEGIVPSTARIVEQNILPLVHGIGLTSIGLEPGNDASKYGKATMEAWRDSFFQRLRRHAAQVCLSDHSDVTEATVKQENAGEDARLTKCKLPHAPMLIAFSGKRQFSWLFSTPLSKIENYGKQTKLPPGWPHELRTDSEVWVLPSSSGRAAMTTAQRTLPYQQLAERLHQIPWGDVKKE